MSRKTKAEIEFELHKQTIYQAASEDCLGVCFEEDRLFAVLVICGYSAAAAYRIAYPQSKANQSSSAVLASRRLREPEIQQTLISLRNTFEAGLLTINTKCFKGRLPRRCAWQAPPKKYFNPHD